MSNCHSGENQSAVGAYRALFDEASRHALERDIRQTERVTETSVTRGARRRCCDGQGPTAASDGVVRSPHPGEVWFRIERTSTEGETGPTNQPVRTTHERARTAHPPRDGRDQTPWKTPTLARVWTDILDTETLHELPPSTVFERRATTRETQSGRLERSECREFRARPSTHPRREALGEAIRSPGRGVHLDRNQSRPTESDWSRLVPTGPHWRPTGARLAPDWAPMAISFVTPTPLCGSFTRRSSSAFRIARGRRSAPDSRCLLDRPPATRSF